jgi:hypothetical protein
MPALLDTYCYINPRIIRFLYGYFIKRIKKLSQNIIPQIRELLLICNFMGSNIVDSIFPLQLEFCEGKICVNHHKIEEKS